MTPDQAFDLLPAAVFRVGRDLRQLYVNDAFCASTGFDRAAMTGVHIRAAGFPPHLTELFVEKVSAVFATGRPAEFAFEFTPPAGHQKLITRLVLEPDGEAVLGVTTDGTALARAEAERDAAEERFRAFMDHSPALAWMKDETGRYVYLSAACRQAFGFAEDEWLGRPDAELWPAAAAAEYRANDLAVLESGRAIQVTESNLRPDGTTQVSMNVKFPFTDAAGRRFVGGVGIDVSPWVEAANTQRAAEDALNAERERQKYEKQLFQSQKLESLGVLAGGVAHDFNNLLTGVLGNAGLARMYLPFADGPAIDCLTQIENAAQRAADLCQQMLAYAGRGQFVVRPVDLNQLINEMAQLLTTVISKKVVLRQNLTPGLPAVVCDATQIRQVVMNLITNGSDAIGTRSGVVTIATGVMEADEKYLAEFDDGRDMPAGRYVYLEVSDTGSGMDEETRARIFEPFFSTKTTGRGLGLSAARGVVLGHRGAVKVYTQVGKGTTFKILLPAGGTIDPPARPAATGLPVFGNGRAVLVIDDEEDIRVLARKAFERAGFAVTLAADGRDGLEAYRADPDKFALVVCDLTMPKMGGAEVFRELRKMRPDVTVILTSGFAAEEATVGFEGKGLAGFLRKPFPILELLAAARKAVGG